jgi:hypothetical protein
VKILAISDVVEPVLYGADLSSYAAGVEAVVSCGDFPFEYLEYVVTFSGAPSSTCTSGSSATANSSPWRLTTSP